MIDARAGQRPSGGLSQRGPTWSTRPARPTSTRPPAFIALLDRHYPAWREASAELNALPLSEPR